MIAIANKSTRSKSTTWQAGFLNLLPLIVKQSQIAFRGKDPEAQEEAITEVIANSACAYNRLHRRGESQRAFASALAKFAIRQFFEGRRTGTSLCSHDVYSEKAMKSAGHERKLLGAPGEQAGEWTESLIDNRQTSIPDQVSFRLDFTRWLEAQSPRDREIAERLALAYSTSEVAREFQLSPGRVSQLRRELARSWQAFIGEEKAEDLDE